MHPEPLADVGATAAACLQSIPYGTLMEQLDIPTIRELVGGRGEEVKAACYESKFCKQDVVTARGGDRRQDGQPIEQEQNYLSGWHATCNSFQQQGPSGPLCSKPRLPTMQGPSCFGDHHRVRRRLPNWAHPLLPCPSQLADS